MGKSTLHDSEIEAFLAAVDQKSPVTHEQTQRFQHFVNQVDQFLLNAPEVQVQKLPRQFGRFLLKQWLGQGGFGVVCLAYDTVMQRDVALKLPRTETMFRPEVRERFLREARTTAVLSHAAIVPVYEVGEENGFWYITSQYCPGPTLAQWLTAHPEPCSFAEAAHVAMTLSDGMAHAHQRSVVHRDLKPSNVLMMPVGDRKGTRLADFTPRITDFGLAKFMDSTEAATRSGVLLGTPQYMAPEQADRRKSDVGPRTDVYALGLILYELLTHQPAFPDLSVILTVRMIIEEDPKPVRLLRPDCPRDLETICAKCLEKQPASRFASAEELRDELKRVLAGEPILSRPVGVVHRVSKWVRREPKVALLLLITIVALMVLAVGSILYPQQLKDINGLLEASLDQSHRAELKTQAALKQSQVLQYVGSIQRAHQALVAGNASEAESYLAPYQKDDPETSELRGYEWHALWKRCQSMPRHQIWYGHRAAPMKLALSPDARWLVTGDDLGEFFVRDAQTGAVIKKLIAAEQGLWSLEISPDGCWLAALSSEFAGNLHQVLVWDTTSWSLHNTYQTRQLAIRAMAFAPESNRLLLGTCSIKEQSNEGSLINWNFQDRSVTGHHHVAAGHCQHLLWNKRRNAWIHVGLDRTQMLDQDLKTMPLWLGPNYYAKGVACSADGHWYAWANPRGEIILYDLHAPGKGPVRIWKAHPDLINHLDFNPQGTMLACSGLGNQVQIWDRATGNLLHHVSTNGTSHGVTFDQDGRSVYFGTADDYAVHRWFFQGSGIGAPITDLKDQIWSLAFAADGKSIVVGLDDDQSDKTLRILDVQKNQLVTSKNIAEHQATVTGTVVIPEVQRMVTSSYDGELVLWDTNTHQILHHVQAHEKPIWDLVFVKHQNCIASCGKDGQIKIWDMNLQQIASVSEHGGKSVAQLAYDPHSETLASAGEDGSVVLWENSGMKPAHRLTAGSQIWGLVFSNDGKMLAYGTKQGFVHLIDVSDLQEKHVLRCHPQGVRSLSFTPDNKSLIVGAEAGKLQVWHVKLGEQLMTMPGDQKRINVLLWSPDGSKLYSGSHDGTLVVYPFK